jgi:hypothetical protein
LSYVDELADAIHRAVPTDLLRDGDTAMLFRLYAVLALAKGDRVALEDVHDAWAAWMAGQNPRHPGAQASAGTLDIRRSGQPYLDAIRAVAREHSLGRRNQLSPR